MIIDFNSRVPLYQLRRPCSWNIFRRMGIVRSVVCDWGLPNCAWRIDLTVSNGCVRTVARAPEILMQKFSLKYPRSVAYQQSHRSRMQSMSLMYCMFAWRIISIVHMLTNRELNSPMKKKRSFAKFRRWIDLLLNGRSLQIVGINPRHKLRNPSDSIDPLNTVKSSE